MQLTLKDVCRYGSGEYQHVMSHNDILKTPPPHNLTIFKGVKNVALTRETSDFLIRQQSAIDYYNWLQDVLVPDENFYSTMVRVKVDWGTGEVSQVVQLGISKWKYYSYSGQKYGNVTRDMPEKHVMVLQVLPGQERAFHLQRGHPRSALAQTERLPNG